MEPQFNTNEAAAVVAGIVRHTKDRASDGKSREEFAKHVAGLRLTSFRPHAGSLAKDPARASNYYLAVDAVAGGKTTPLLMHVAMDSSAAGKVLADPVRTERVQVEGKEVVLSFIPFSSYDHESIRKFAEQVDRAFLPRPQRS